MDDIIKNSERCEQDNIKAYMKTRDQSLNVLGQVEKQRNRLRGIGKAIHLNAGIFPLLDNNLRIRLRDIGINLILMKELLDETIKQIEDEDARRKGGYSKREWAIHKRTSRMKEGE